MKFLVYYKVLPKFNDVGSLLLDNRKSFCEKHGYGFYYDTKDIKNPNRHYSFDAISSIVDMLKNSPLDFEWLGYNTHEFIVNDNTLGFQDMLDQFAHKDCKLLLSHFVLKPSKEVPVMPFFETINGELRMRFHPRERSIITACGMIIKRCPETIKLFEDIYNDMRFEIGDFKKITQDQDMAEIALTVHHEEHPEYHDWWTRIDIGNWSCLPQGEGEAYTEFKEAVKIALPELPPYKKSIWLTFTSCVSRGVSKEATRQIIEDAKGYVKP